MSAAQKRWSRASALHIVRLSRRSLENCIVVHVLYGRWSRLTLSHKDTFTARTTAHAQRSCQRTSDATNAQKYADTQTLMRDGSQHANRIRQTHRCAELRAVANLVARRAPCSTVLVTSGERAMKQSMLRLLCIDCTAQQQCRESLYSRHHSCR